MRSICGLARFLAPLIVCVFCPLVAVAQVQDIRIVTYNTQADVGINNGTLIPNLATVLEGVGQQKYTGDNILQLPDIIALQETTSNSTTVQPLVSDLNSYYGSSVFSYSSYQATTSGGTSDGGGPNALIYNSNTINLIASVGVGAANGTLNGEFREVVRYEFQPKVDASTNNGIFYVYDSHYKAGDPTTTDGGVQDQTLRNEEAQIIRDDEAANLPATARVLYVGDYNMRDSSDPSYQTITAPNSPSNVNQGQAWDPMNPTFNSSLDWYENQGFASLLTEADDDLYGRFDMQAMTGNVYNDTAGGLNFISGSYHPFGNNGTEHEGDNINAGTNTSLADTQGNGTQGFAGTGTLTVSQLLDAMNSTTGADHLPVVADYSIVIPEPATLGVLVCGSAILLRRRRSNRGSRVVGGRRGRSLVGGRIPG